MQIEFIKKSEVPNIAGRGRRNDEWDRMIKPFLESSHSDREAIKITLENSNKAKHFVSYVQLQAKKAKIAVRATQRKDLVYVWKDEEVES